MLCQVVGYIDFLKIVSSIIFFKFNVKIPTENIMYNILPNYLILCLLQLIVLLDFLIKQNIMTKKSLVLDTI